MNKVRVAVIGVGNMGSAHAKHIADGSIAGMELVAVCDPDEAKLNWSRERLGDIAFYKDYHQLLDDHICDAVIIATPTICTLSSPLKPLKRATMYSAKSRQVCTPSRYG